MAMRKSLQFTCGGNDFSSFGILTREGSTILLFLAVLAAEPDSYKISARREVAMRGWELPHLRGINRSDCSNQELPEFSACCPRAVTGVRRDRTAGQSRRAAG
jgi:hypothetical protein